MSLVGGERAAEEPTIELGRCQDCGAWVRGRWVDDLTQHIALVEHDGCPMALAAEE